MHGHDGRPALGWNQSETKSRNLPIRRVSTNGIALSSHLFQQNRIRPITSSCLMSLFPSVLGLGQEASRHAGRQHHTRVLICNSGFRQQRTSDARSTFVRGASLTCCLCSHLGFPRVWQFFSLGVGTVTPVGSGR